MTANGWVIRSGPGWPGVLGATFCPESVSFVDYPDQTGNRLLRITSSTDGMSENTYQTQICHQRKYLEGTYAARVRFSDVPVSGVDGDQVVETFYTITPYQLHAGEPGGLAYIAHTGNRWNGLLFHGWEADCAAWWAILSGCPHVDQFNLWFIDGGLAQAEGVREYQEDIDWVFHEAGVLLMPDEVNVKVNELRDTAVESQVTVLSGIQTSPCDL